MRGKSILGHLIFLIGLRMEFFKKIFQHLCENPLRDYNSEKKTEINWNYLKADGRIHGNRNGIYFSKTKRRSSSSKRDIKSLDMSFNVRDKKRFRNLSYDQRPHPHSSISSPLSTNPNPWIIWTVYLSVIFVSTLSYSNSLDGDFVHDDLSAITTNGDVIGKSSIWTIFLNDFWGKPMADRSSHKSYRPLTILTFRLNAFIHDLEPRGFHIFNVALHATVSTVFVKVCLQVAKMSLTSAFIAGLHFSIHPIHTEAVSGIVGRADVLACLFVLISLLSYHRCQKRNNKNLFMLSMLLSLCAMLSKEHGITVLGVNFCWDIFINRQPIYKCVIYGSLTLRVRKLINRLCFVGFWGLGLIFYRLTMLQGSLPQFSDQDNPASFNSAYYTRMRTFAYLPAFNFWLLLAPISLNYDWQMGSIPLISQWTDLRNFGCLIFYLFVFTSFLYPAWKGTPRRDVTLGLLLLIIPFIPASNILFRVGFVVAERILYIPSLGFSVLVGAGTAKMIIQQKSLKISVIKILFVLALSLFAIKTWQRNQDWRNRETLFTSGLRMLPHNAKMHYNYANLQKDLGNVDQAIYHYREALRLWPRHASAHNNLGTLLNDTSKAEDHFQQALKINPNHANAYFNLANLKYQDGKTHLAIRLMERSNELEPNNPDALTNLAAMYADVGMTKKAKHLHLEVLKLEPKNADHLNNFAAFLQKIGSLKDALKYYQEALNQDGNHTVALLNAARLMKKLKLNDKAELLYQRALLRDDDPQTKYGLAVLYLNTGKANKAERLFHEVLQQQPNDSMAKVHLAQAHVHQGQFEEAETLLLAEIKQPVNSIPREILHQLATLYSYLNRTNEAISYIKLALETCNSTDLTCASLYAFHGDLSKDLDDTESAVLNYQQVDKMLHSICMKKSRLAFLRLCSVFTHVQLNLGAIYHAKGMLQKAEKYYQIALMQSPSNKVLLENIRKLKKAEYTNSSCGPYQDYSHNLLTSNFIIE